MKEVEFKDRIPTHAGRVTLTPVEGQPDTFIMTRADEPLEPGTPLNKATFDSVIHSRLTGRYYEPTVTRNQTSVQSGITVNPIPTSGWTIDSTRTIITNKGYKITASSTAGQADPDRAVDGEFSTYWSSRSEATHTFTIQLDEAIILRKIMLRYKAEEFVFVPDVVLQGSADGGITWENLWSIETNMQTKTEITLTSPGLYSYYRLSFTLSDDIPIYLYDFEFSEYDLNFYHNEFTIENGLPVTFTTEQRLMLVIPENTITMGVTTNSLNGVVINTILQPTKRYELRYTGSVFVAKEV
jgi:hypothetical protein